MVIMSATVDSKKNAGEVRCVKAYRYKYKAYRDYRNSVVVVGTDTTRHYCGILEYAHDEGEAERIISRMKKDHRIHDVHMHNCSKQVHVLRVGK